MKVNAYNLIKTAQKGVRLTPASMSPAGYKEISKKTRNKMEVKLSNHIDTLIQEASRIGEDFVLLEKKREETATKRQKYTKKYYSKKYNFTLQSCRKSV